MKRILGILAILALVAITAQAVEVKSENVAGVINVTVPGDGGYNLVAINLDALDPSANNLQGVFGEQLRAGVIPALADQVLIYDTGAAAYKRYALKTTDGLFYDTTDWSGSATNPPLVSGQAVWVKTGTGLSDLDLSLVGQAVEASQQQIAMVSGYQLSGYPYSSNPDANDTGLNLSAGVATPGVIPALADQILVWNPGTQGYDRYGLKTGTGWVNVTNWASGPAEAPIPLGSGFWYVANGSFTWTESIPYSL